MKLNAKTIHPYALTAFQGGWHPAVTDGQNVWYWPNVTQDDRWKAQEWAEDAIERAIEDGTQAAVDQWNVYLTEPREA
jgi:hypothetical protein